MAILHITTSLLMGRTQTELWALTSTTASAFGGRTSHRKTTKSSQRSLSRAGDVGTIVVPALLSISSTTGLLEVLLNHTINNHVGGSLLTNSANSSLYESANIQQTKVPTHSVALQIVLARYLSRMAVSAACDYSLAWPIATQSHPCGLLFYPGRDTANAGSSVTLRDH
jgi:hypothetical protein